ncbi:MAG: peptidoglycan-associated lipoprotein Pal [Betaproteobacteria bacterium]|nr:peptidoglycan-associated lipoprotein Pal [Betaproteobacteria bacterium]MCC7217352.1 peptidoglycan-associated lipoprotein Pal [Burkholderiales bacterium]
MKRIVLAAIAAAFLAGCQTTPTTAPVEDKSAAGDPSAAATAGASTSGTSTAGVGGTSMAEKDPRKDPGNILYKRSIYFEFDSFAVADQYKPLIEAHAKYLAANRNAKVALQGHADERGSREYNIALGQKRSDAVKRMMTLLGVQEAIVETVSFGEEKPKNPGHDEASWAENRRVDIFYAGE